MKTCLIKKSCNRWVMSFITEAYTVNELPFNFTQPPVLDFSLHIFVFVLPEIS